jgi:hypothetical protein
VDERHNSRKCQRFLFVCFPERRQETLSSPPKKKKILSYSYFENSNTGFSLGLDVGFLPVPKHLSARGMVSNYF